MHIIYNPGRGLYDTTFWCNETCLAWMSGARHGGRGLETSRDTHIIGRGVQETYYSVLAGPRLISKLGRGKARQWLAMQ